MEEYELIGGPRDGESVVMSDFFEIAYIPASGGGVYLINKELITITENDGTVDYYAMTSEKRYGEGLENDEYKYGSWMGKIMNTN